MSNFNIEVIFDETSPITIAQEENTVDVSLNPTEPTFGLVAVPGQKGDQGIPGPKGDPGTEWWYGNGEPTVIVGAKPNDYYIDNITGLVYKLQ